MLFHSQVAAVYLRRRLRLFSDCKIMPQSKNTHDQLQSHRQQQMKYLDVDNWLAYNMRIWMIKFVGMLTMDTINIKQAKNIIYSAIVTKPDIIHYQQQCNNPIITQPQNTNKRTKSQQPNTQKNINTITHNNHINILTHLQQQILHLIQTSIHIHAAQKISNIIYYLCQCQLQHKQQCNSSYTKWHRMLAQFFDRVLNKLMNVLDNIHRYKTVKDDSNINSNRDGVCIDRWDKYAYKLCIIVTDMFIFGIYYTQQQYISMLTQLLSVSVIECNNDSSNNAYVEQNKYCNQYNNIHRFITYYLYKYIPMLINNNNIQIIPSTHKHLHNNDNTKNDHDIRVLLMLPQNITKILDLVVDLFHRIYLPILAQIKQSMFIKLAKLEHVYAHMKMSMNRLLSTYNKHHNNNDKNTQVQQQHIKQLQILQQIRQYEQQYIQQVRKYEQYRQQTTSVLLAILNYNTNIASQSSDRNQNDNKYAKIQQIYVTVVQQHPSVYQLLHHQHQDLGDVDVKMQKKKQQEQQQQQQLQEQEQEQSQAQDQCEQVNSLVIQQCSNNDKLQQGNIQKQQNKSKNAIYDQQINKYVKKQNKLLHRIYSSCKYYQNKPYIQINPIYSSTKINIKHTISSIQAPTTNISNTNTNNMKTNTNNVTTTSTTKLLLQHSHTNIYKYIQQLPQQFISKLKNTTSIQQSRRLSILFLQQYNKHANRVLLVTIIFEQMNERNNLAYICKVVHYLAENQRNQFVMIIYDKIKQMHSKSNGKIGKGVYGRYMPVVIQFIKYQLYRPYGYLVELYSMVCIMNNNNNNNLSNNNTNYKQQHKKPTQLSHIIKCNINNNLYNQINSLQINNEDITTNNNNNTVQQLYLPTLIGILQKLSHHIYYHQLLTHLLINEIIHEANTQIKSRNISYQLEVINRYNSIVSFLRLKNSNSNNNNMQMNGIQFGDEVMHDDHEYDSQVYYANRVYRNDKQVNREMISAQSIKTHQGFNDKLHYLLDILDNNYQQQQKQQQQQEQQQYKQKQTIEPISRICHIIQSSLQNTNYLQCYLYAQLIFQLNSKLIDMSICHMTLNNIIKHLNNNNYQYAISWSRFLGQLVHFKIVSLNTYLQFFDNKLFVQYFNYDIYGYVGVLCASLTVCSNKIKNQMTVQQLNLILIFLLKIKKSLLKLAGLKNNLILQQEFQDLIEYFHTAFKFIRNIQWCNYVQTLIQSRSKYAVDMDNYYKESKGKAKNKGKNKQKQKYQQKYQFNIQKILDQLQKQCKIKQQQQQQQRNQQNQLQNKLQKEIQAEKQENQTKIKDKRKHQKQVYKQKYKQKNTNKVIKGSTNGYLGKQDKNNQKQSVKKQSNYNQNGHTYKNSKIQQYEKIQQVSFQFQLQKQLQQQQKIQIQIQKQKQQLVQFDKYKDKVQLNSNGEKMSKISQTETIQPPSQISTLAQVTVKKIKIIGRSKNSRKVQEKQITAQS